MGKAFDNWLKKATEDDQKLHPGNILMPGGMTPSQFQDILVEDILGSDWYVAYPCNGDQARAEIVAAILDKVNKPKSWLEKLFS